MNKAKKSHRSFSWIEVCLLVISGVILMVAGVTHAWLKNSQVEVVRAADKTQQRIDDHNDAINSLQVKIDKKLNIYQLRDDLERRGSELVEVPVNAIVKIPLYTRSETPDQRVSAVQR